MWPRRLSALNPPLSTQLSRVVTRCCQQQQQCWSGRGADDHVDSAATDAVKLNTSADCNVYNSLNDEFTDQLSSDWGQPRRYETVDETCSRDQSSHETTHMSWDEVRSVVIATNLQPLASSATPPQLRIYTGNCGETEGSQGAAANE